MDFAMAAELWRQCVFCKLETAVTDAEKSMQSSSADSSLDPEDTSQIEELHRQLDNMRLRCQDLSRLTLVGANKDENEDGEDAKENRSSAITLLQLQHTPRILEDLQRVVSSINIQDVETRASLAKGHLKKPPLILFSSASMTSMADRDVQKRQAQRARAEFITKCAVTIENTLTGSFEQVQLVLADQRHLYRQYMRGLHSIFNDAHATLKQTIQLQTEWYTEASKSTQRQWKNEKTRLIENYRQYAVQLVGWMRKQSRYEEGVVQLLELYESNSAEIDALAETELLKARKPAVSWQVLAAPDQINIQSAQDLQLPLRKAAEEEEEEEQEDEDDKLEDEKHTIKNRNGDRDASFVRKCIIDLSAHKSEFDDLCDSLTRSETHLCIVEGSGHISQLTHMTSQWRTMLWPVMYRLCATRYYVKRKQAALAAEYADREQEALSVKKQIGKMREREDRLLQDTLKAHASHMHIPAHQVKKNTALQSEILKVLPLQQELNNHCRKLQKALQRNTEFVNFSDLVASHTGDLKMFTDIEDDLKSRSAYIKHNFESKQLHNQQQVEAKLTKQLTEVSAFVMRKFNDLEKARELYETKIWAEYSRSWIKKQPQLALNENHIMQYHDEVALIGEFAPELSRLAGCVHKITESFTQHVSRLRMQVQLSTIDVMLEFCNDMLPALPEPVTTTQQEEAEIEAEAEVENGNEIEQETESSGEIEVDRNVENEIESSSS